MWILLILSLCLSLLAIARWFTYRRCLRQAQEPAKVLARYGLQDALEESDDPALWAILLQKHWTWPYNLQTDAERFAFAKGKTIAQPTGPLERTKQLHFRLVAGDALQAYEAEPSDWSRYPSFSLVLVQETPDQALVQVSKQFSQRAGFGRLERWERRPAGWLCTGSPLSWKH